MAQGRVIVTGGGGYIGSWLVKQLLDAGYEVEVLDRFFFGSDVLGSGHPRLFLSQADIRNVTPERFEGVHAVCDLAALSNDPCGDLDPELTSAINHRGRVHVAHCARSAGVPRYVLASSCSVYGHGGDGTAKETDPASPLTAYASSTLRAEEEILALAGDSFCPVALRNATVFGLSPRMRFDLVVNLMTLHAIERSRITVMGSGRQWRPLVHVVDAARAVCRAIEAPAEKVSGEVFNIGLTNLQVVSIAYVVRENLPFPVSVEVAPDDPDRRNYRVSFEKAAGQLGFEARIGVDDAVREIYEAIRNGLVDTGPRTVTVGWYRYLIEAEKLLNDLRLDGKLI